MGDTQRKNKTSDQTHAAPAADHLQLVTFAVGDVDLAVDILSVREITRVRNLARVPHTSDGVEGVISLRGDIIPVINLASRLDQPPRDRNEHGRIIIVEMRSQTVGLIATEVHDVVRIDRSDVAPAPPMVCPIDSDCIAGFVKRARRPITLLNLDALIESLQRALAASLDDANLTSADAPLDAEHPNQDPQDHPDRTRPSKMATT